MDTGRERRRTTQYSPPHRFTSTFKSCGSSSVGSSFGCGIAWQGAHRHKAQNDHVSEFRHHAAAGVGLLFDKRDVSTSTYLAVEEVQLRGHAQLRRHQLPVPVRAPSLPQGRGARERRRRRLLRHLGLTLAVVGEEHQHRLALDVAVHLAKQGGEDGHDGTVSDRYEGLVCPWGPWGLTSSCRLILSIFSLLP